MIVAKLKDAADYRGITPMLDKALEYLNDEFLNTVGTEATHMDGDDLYATLNLFETQPDEKGFFETDGNTPLLTAFGEDKFAAGHRDQERKQK